MPGFDLSQAFTTGGNARGYTLTRADILMLSGRETEPTYTVSIHSDSSNSPGASLGTLTNPVSWPTTVGPGQHRFGRRNRPGAQHDLLAHI